MRTYTTAFTQYRNQTVDYRPVRMAAGDTDVVVKSLIRQPGGPPIAVDYSMEKLPPGWKVYDVKIEGISLVENYRNTFNGEIQRDGVDGLIRTLRDKNKALAAQAKRAAMITCKDGRCQVEGPITMGNVTAVLAESARLFEGAAVVVDLAGVTDVDSAAVSLLLEWRRAAAKASRRIDSRTCPPSLTSLAELYGVSHLIGA